MHISGPNNTNIRVNGYAWTNNDCNAIGSISFSIVLPPLHGAFCQRPARMILHKTVVNNLSHCLSTPVDGREVLYVADAGYVGGDTGRFIVNFPTKEHVVDVTVILLPPAANPPSPPFDLFWGRRQTAGPLPPCTPPQTSMLMARP